MREAMRVLTLFLICKICSGQFFYNYERDEPTYPQSSSESVDPSQYQYVPPSAVEERYSRQIQPQPVLQNTESVRRRNKPQQQIVVADMNSDDQYYQQPSVQPEQQGEVRSSRRTVHRKKLIRSGNASNRNINQVEVVQPPKQYGPSVFENIGLGEAPTGVHVPEDSLLNILRGNNPVIQSYQPRHIQQAPSIQYTAPQTTAVQPYLQSSEIIRSGPRSRQQVQVVEPPSNGYFYQQQSTQQQYVQPEVVQPQEEIRNSRRNSQRSQRPRSGNSSNRNVNQIQMLQPPKQYGPSVFENIGLGEAPSGVHVPEDSLLNILRGNTPVLHYNQPRHVQQAPPVQYTAPQTTAVQPYTQQNHFQPDLQDTEIIRRRPRSRQQVEVVEAPSEDHYYQQQSPQAQYAQQEVSQSQEEVQNIRRNSQRKQRPRPENSSSRKENKMQVQRPPKQYGPSVFENIGLGEAPSGIYIPEDSLLNILRSNDAGARSVQSRRSQEAPSVQHASAQPSSPLQGPQNINYDNQRVNIERRPARQSYVQPSPPSQQLHHDVSPNYDTNAQPQPQRETRRNTQRRTQQPKLDEIPQRRAPPQTVYEVSEQPLPRASAPRSQRRRDEIPQRRAPPPPQIVYEVPEQQNVANYNSDCEDDIMRHSPRNADHRSRQQVSPPQNQQHASDYQATPAPRQKPALKTANLAIAALPDDVDGDGIPGEARSDYPTLHVIPVTSFSCSEQPYNGYYADLETSCQVVHMCQAGGVQSSYLCPNGTIFSQEKFSCQWWYKVNCADSPRFYSNNDSLYKVPSPPSRKKKN